MIYKRDFEVDVHDTDFNGVAKTGALMKYIQSAANLQLSANGMSYDELRRISRAFILSRITMEFTEELRAYDHVSALTYPCESRGYAFIRCYSLEKDEKTIGRAISVWALVDTDTKKLVEVNNFDLGLETHKPLELAIGRFSIPSILTEVGEYVVSYGDIDKNMHMNNTAYPDMYATFLPMSGKRIHSLSINYINEAPLGEKLRVYRVMGDDGIWYIRTVREDGKTNTEAEILLVDVK